VINASTVHARHPPARPCLANSIDRCQLDRSRKAACRGAERHATSSRRPSRDPPSQSERTIHTSRIDAVDADWPNRMPQTAVSNCRWDSARRGRFDVAGTAQPNR